MSRPQHHKARRLRLIPAALGLGAVVALSGCSAGQITETDTQVAAVNGGSGDVGEIAVRNAEFSFPAAGSAYPQGSSAPLEVVIANEGPDDRLVAVRSPYAANVQVTGEQALPSGTALHAYGLHVPGQVRPPEQRAVNITVNGFTEQITAGVTIPVTFAFEKAGEVTVQVPIGQDVEPRPEHNSPEHGPEQTGH
ncbi:hypothetical protein [Saccharopolyspora cebuensis]|uniref:Copper(I)-binding protein n=1 Tax=Saccharopolyspora cebuensis TaxID=418759 RepID=A0ABV4CKH4_9PSEU